MARLVRDLPFPRPLKRFLPLLAMSSFASGALKNFHHTEQNFMLSNRMKDKALYLLNSCKSLTHIFQIQAYLITSDLFQDPSFSGRLLKISSKLSDDFNYTVLIFRYIDWPDAFCVNRLLKHYSCNGNHKKAVVFYVQIRRNNLFSPNGFTFPIVISACAKLQCLSLGQMIYGEAVKFGVDGILHVQNSIMLLYASCGIMDAARKIFDEIPSKDLVSSNMIIDGFVKVGDLDMAHSIFDAIREKNVITWNVMISGYLNLQNPGIALKLFRKMMRLGYKSNDTTMVNVLTACGRSNRSKEGKSVHGFILKMFSYSSMIVDSTIVHMYSKCKRIDYAEQIFARMPSRSLVSWNVMILGHCIHGNPVDGLNLYEEMVGKIGRHSKSDLDSVIDINRGENCISTPDEITFIGVLCACARIGLLTGGRNYFSQMIDVFHLKPNFAHYWCMANLVANAGFRQEAVDILKNIPIETYEFPESSLWAGLLGSCRFESGVYFGEKIAKNLIEQDPENFSYYSLLVNIYAVAGKWEDVDKTKNVMKDRGIRRIPGCNLRDLKEVVHNMTSMPMNL